mmetsp:Transcript_8164/g.24614  ORF Transcript_8164/g.24614 Transcript_8164/m.24614 type:complete len:341 (+) Transcript_8164:2225-3247(+)
MIRSSAGMICMSFFLPFFFFIVAATSSASMMRPVTVSSRGGPVYWRLLMPLVSWRSETVSNTGRSAAGSWSCCDAVASSSPSASSGGAAGAGTFGLTDSADTMTLDRRSDRPLRSSLSSGKNASSSIVLPAAGWAGSIAEARASDSDDDIARSAAAPSAGVDATSAVAPASERSAAKAALLLSVSGAASAGEAERDCGRRSLFSGVPRLRRAGDERPVGRLFSMSSPLWCEALNVSGGTSSRAIISRSNSERRPCSDAMHTPRSVLNLSRISCIRFSCSATLAAWPSGSPSTSCTPSAFSYICAREPSSDAISSLARASRSSARRTSWRICSSLALRPSQ